MWERWEPIIGLFKYCLIYSNRNVFQINLTFEKKYTKFRIFLYVNGINHENYGIDCVQRGNFIRVYITFIS